MIKTYFYLDLSVPAELDAYRYLEAFGKDSAAVVRHCFVAAWLVHGKTKPRDFIKNESLSIIDPANTNLKKVTLRWSSDLENHPVVFVVDNASTLKRQYRGPYLTKLLLCGVSLLTGNKALEFGTPVPSEKPVPISKQGNGIIEQSNQLAKPKGVIEPIEQPVKKSFKNLMGKRR